MQWRYTENWLSWRFSLLGLDSIAPFIIGLSVSGYIKVLSCENTKKPCSDYFAPSVVTEQPSLKPFLFYFPVSNSGVRVGGSDFVFQYIWFSQEVYSLLLCTLRQTRKLRLIGCLFFTMFLESKTLGCIIKEVVCGRPGTFLTELHMKRKYCFSSSTHYAAWNRSTLDAVSCSIALKSPLPL